MAIGENNFNSGSEEGATGNRSGRNGDYTYYSPIKFNRAERDKSFSVEFQGGLLRFKLTSTNMMGQWQREPDAIISISPTKATLLASELMKMKKYIADGKIDGRSFGINGGMNEKISFIAFTPTEDGKITITIGKFDGNGNIVERADSTLNYDYHYALEWKNLDKMDMEKVYYNILELDQIIALMTDFGRYMNGAAGYATQYIARYNDARFHTRLDQIFDALGIERIQGRYNNGVRAQNDFLNNTGGRSESSGFEDLFDDE